MKTIICTEIDSHELEEIVRKKFKVSDYIFVESEVVGNISEKMFNFSESDITDFNWHNWARFLEGSSQTYVTCLIIARLIMLGVIPKGNVLVRSLG